MGSQTVPPSLLKPEELDAMLRGGMSPNTVICKIAKLTLASYYASLGSVNHLRVLKDWGADFETRNIAGRNPLQEAKYKYRKTGAEQFRACAEYLRSIMDQERESRPPIFASPTLSSDIHAWQESGEDED